MFCKECGKENRNDSKFCVECGAPLHDYTKPKQDLIMPEEIEKKQKAIKHKKNISKIFNYISLSLIVVAVTFSILTFFVPEKAKLAFAILCLVLYSMILILEISKAIIIKHIKSSVKK